MRGYVSYGGLFPPRPPIGPAKAVARTAVLGLFLLGGAVWYLLNGFLVGTYRAFEHDNVWMTIFFFPGVVLVLAVVGATVARILCIPRPWTIAAITGALGYLALFTFLMLRFGLNVNPMGGWGMAVAWLGLAVLAYPAAAVLAQARTRRPKLIAMALLATVLAGLLAHTMTSRHRWRAEAYTAATYYGHVQVLDVNGFRITGAGQEYSIDLGDDALVYKLIGTEDGPFPGTRLKVSTALSGTGTYHVEAWPYGELDRSLFDHVTTHSRLRPTSVDYLVHLPDWTLNP